MGIVARLLLREEIDALDHELAAAKRNKLALRRIQELQAEVERLEDRYAAGRRAEIENRFAG